MTSSCDERLAVWAGRHHLVITTLQLAKLEFSPTMIQTRRRRAQLHPSTAASGRSAPLG